MGVFGQFNTMNASCGAGSSENFGHAADMRACDAMAYQQNLFQTLKKKYILANFVRNKYKPIILA